MTYSIYNILYHHLCNNTLRKYIKLCQLEMYFIIAINLVNVTHHSQRIAPWVCFFFFRRRMCNLIHRNCNFYFYFCKISQAIYYILFTDYLDLYSRSDLGVGLLFLYQRTVSCLNIFVFLGEAASILFRDENMRGTIDCTHMRNK